MNKPIIVILVTARQFKALAALIQHVILNMTGNLNFVTPSPTLLAMQTALADLNNAIGAWGTKANRGGHNDYVNLLAKSTLAHAMLTQLAAYCMTVVDPNSTFEVQTTILASSGFPLKNAATPQGVLGMVQNFHRFFAPELNPDQIKLKWKKPLNITSKGNVKNYNVYRNTTNNYATSSVIASIPHTTFTDTAISGTWFYWIVATNTNGNGAVSNVISFTSTPVI